MALKIIRLSLKAILNNKLRSFLTMLGIIIGVAAVVILVSITQNAAGGISESISDMGSLQITATVSDEDISLSADTIEELTSYPAINAVSPVISTNQTARKNSTSKSYTTVGVTPSYFEVMDIDIQRGRFIMNSDVEWETKVCILGTQAAYDLFGTWDAVNGTVILGDNIYTVVGVLEEQGSSLAGSDDSKILIPYSSARKLSGQTGATSFYVKAQSEESVEMAISQTENFLLRLTNDEDAFEVSNQSQVLETMGDVDNTMSLLLAGIAAISLIVGGIGIMNIMLVSVSERTREIGIRKAVGAKRRHIMLQFLCEACILSVLGGVLGLLISFAGIRIYNVITSSAAALNGIVSVAAIVFCAIIGVTFGSYPAAKASKLLPIEALHSS